MYTLCVRINIHMTSANAAIRTNCSEEVCMHNSIWLTLIDSVSVFTGRNIIAVLAGFVPRVTLHTQ